jgi:SNF2 family DNA or RNA helicase
MLVFSTFVSALTLIRKALEDRGIRYAYLDGSTRDRQGVCDTFNGDDGIPVLLMSLKAGGTGLNLTGADTVVHYDPWWNPAAEAQATDRAHRIGQTRKVTSIKLIASGTIEERVMELQRSKSEMLRKLLSESDAASAKISLAEIKALLED